jgi:hypothetical protein
VSSGLNSRMSKFVVAAAKCRFAAVASGPIGFVGADLPSRAETSQVRRGVRP